MCASICRTSWSLSLQSLRFVRFVDRCTARWQAGRRHTTSSTLSRLPSVTSGGIIYRDQDRPRRLHLHDLARRPSTPARARVARRQVGPEVGLGAPQADAGIRNREAGALIRELEEEGLL